jgi:hypothetical protein
MVVATVAIPAKALDLTEYQLEVGRARRFDAIQQAVATVSDLETKERQTRSLAERRQIAAEVKSAKRALNIVRNRSVEDYAKDAIAEKQQEADKQERMIQQREEELRADEVRRQVSGDCPLKVDAANFAHLTDVTLLALFHKVDAETTLGFEPVTAIVFEVTNRAMEDAIAWEFTWELLDGFDEVIATGSHKSPSITSGEKGLVRVGTRHIPSAMQMRIHLQRVKLRNGDTWEWNPEYQEVGLLVKKLEGADLLKSGK